MPRDAAVVDIAADRGYFIRNIDAAEKWATDLRPMQPFLPREVRFVEANSMDLRDHLPLAHFDIAFISNFLEHLPTSEAVVEQLAVVHDLLKPGGRLIVLQPNIRLVGGQYWDFIDHQVGLTEKSLQEAAELAGLATSELITRFVPYTTKSRYPRHPFLVRAYLQLPFLWLILGKQSLYIGERQRATTIRPEASEL